MEHRKKIKLIAQATFATGLFTVIGGFWYLMEYFTNTKNNHEASLISILLVVGVFIFIVLIFMYASNTKCPHCSKPIHLGYGSSNLEGFVVPKQCLYCKKEI